MRSCSTCGTQIDSSSLFCPSCGGKVPPESRPTEAQTSVRVERVDPLASTSPASVSPARKGLDPYAATAPASKSPARILEPIESLPLSPVSPKAGTGFQASPVKVEAAPPAASSGPSLPSGTGSPAVPAISGRASVPKVSTRGKTAPLSAVPHLAAKVNPRPSVPVAPPPQAIPALAQPPRLSPVPPARVSHPQGPYVAPAGPSAAPLPVAPPAAFAAVPFPPGRRVLVQWANGQRYPGVVQQVNGAQCLVRFDAGGEPRWIEMRYMTPLG
jgi:hypothetical protein